MRRTIAFVTLWFVAGAAATTAAWLGVSTVSEQLAGSGSHPDPLSAEEIAAQAAQASTTGTGATSTSTTATTLPGGTTSTTVGSTPTTVTPPTTAAPPPQSVVRSYDLVGGSATLRFSPSGVTVVIATPKAGFSVDIGDSHSGGKRVEFESDDHRSRLDGWWDGGPQDEVREDD